MTNTHAHKEIQIHNHTYTDTHPWHLASPPYIHVIRTMASRRAVDSTWPRRDPSLTRPSDLCLPASTHPPPEPCLRTNWCSQTWFNVLGRVENVCINQPDYVDGSGLVHRKCNLLQVTSCPINTQSSSERPDNVLHEANGEQIMSLAL